jgi:hypothetical protein
MEDLCWPNRGKRIRELTPEMMADMKAAGLRDKDIKEIAYIVGVSRRTRSLQENMVIILDWMMKREELLKKGVPAVKLPA